MSATSSFRSGFAAIIGRPNVGKSTLMNQIIGQKVSIMSDKPQTTRNKIQGVYTSDHCQIIFIDTPGIHKPKTRLGDYMNSAAHSALSGVDVILMLVDVEQGPGAGDRYIIEQLQKVATPALLVMNKIDRVHPEALLPLIDEYRSLHAFAEYIPVSAKFGNNVGTLLERIVQFLPEGPKYYPDDQVSDHPEQFICAELIREKLLLATREEIPHSIAVYIEEMKARGNGVVDIRAVILAERESQKGIIIGKNGRMLKEIGRQARLEIEQLLGSRIYLELWVKVEKNWRNRQHLLYELGFRDGSE